MRTIHATFPAVHLSHWLRLVSIFSGFLSLFVLHVGSNGATAKRVGKKHFSATWAVKSTCFPCRSVNISVIDIWITRLATWEEVWLCRNHSSNEDFILKAIQEQPAIVTAFYRTVSDIKVSDMKRIRVESCVLCCELPSQDVLTLYCLRESPNPSVRHNDPEWFPFCKQKSWFTT